VVNPAPCDRSPVMTPNTVDRLHPRHAGDR
jgi:hypothetical protein